MKTKNNKKAQMKTKKTGSFLVFNIFKNKRAQLKIQQMSFMLLAVTIFFVLVGVLILSYKLSGLRQIATELNEENAMTLATKLANSPEFSCGEAFDNIKTSCVDADKVMVLRDNIAKYSKFWGVTNIEIRKIYPSDEQEIICTLGNYPNCNLIRLKSSEISVYDSSNFVSLCRKESLEGKIYDKCELAKIIIKYE